MHAHVLDFPGAITCGAGLGEARRLLASALLDLAGYALERSESLPRPDPSQSDPDTDLEEPIYLHLRASTAVEVFPAGVVVPLVGGNRFDTCGGMAAFWCARARTTPSG